MIVPPDIDARNREAILKRMRALLPFYMPEWRTETPAGTALLQSAANMLEGLLARLNQVPLKNYIAFLEMLGVKLLPPQPARVPLTFFLSKGAQDARQSVRIPQRSQAAGSSHAGEAIFETEHEILATPANLQAIVSLVPDSDQIFEHGADLNEGRNVELFADPQHNRQEHSLYLAHDERFSVKGKGTIFIELMLDHAVVVDDQLTTALQASLSWEWWNGTYWVPSSIPAYGSLLRHSLASATVPMTTLSDVLDENHSTISVETNVESDARFPKQGLLLIDNEIIKYGGKRGKTFIDLKRGVGSQGDAEGAIHKATAAGAHLVGSSVWAIDEPLRVTVTLADAAQRVIVSLEKCFEASFTKTKVKDIESSWIRCRAPGKILTEEFASIRNLRIDTVRTTLGASKDDNRLPDALFYNDIPLNPDAPPIFPFGTRAGTLDAFYIASSRAFSQKGASITLRFTAPDGNTSERPSPTALLSWEYWNGSGWTVIRGIKPDPEPFAFPAWGAWNDTKWDTFAEEQKATTAIEFSCPADFAPVLVNGQENYWIRIRIASGDYGKEEYKLVGEAQNQVWKPDLTRINPPAIGRLEVSYAYNEGQPDFKPLDHCLTYDNLTYSDQSENARASGQPFTAFIPMDTAIATGIGIVTQSLYLGFDLPPIKGSISMFFSLLPQEYTEASLPRLSWEYYRLAAGELQGEWAPLHIEDNTSRLTESGTIQFDGPLDFTQIECLGQMLYWIRVRDDNNAFQPRTLGEAVAQDTRTRFRTWSGDLALEEFAPPFSSIKAGSRPTAPRVQGIYLNTTWAIQTETIEDEILGVDDDSSDQANGGTILSSGVDNVRNLFTLNRVPALTAEVWVNELSTLSEGEREALGKQNDLKTTEEKDAQRTLIEFWVRWNAVDDLLSAKATDRVYTIDLVSGQLQFGDGVHGMALPIGRNRIKATYTVGGGEIGNLGVDTITTLRTTIPFVERVTNPEPAGGGSNTERVEDTLVRGPRHIKHRGRAVTRDDYEWLARDASRAVARAKCLPTFDDTGSSDTTGWVTIIIVPDSQERRPLPSPQLLRQVELYLSERAPAVVTSRSALRVSGPTYVEVAVTATLISQRIDRSSEVEGQAFDRLDAFLHPLTGGDRHTGWEFGRLPFLSDFYSLLEAIDGLDHVAELTMTLTARSPTGVVVGEPRLITEERPLDSHMPEYALVCSGNHTIILEAPE